MLYANIQQAISPFNGELVFHPKETRKSISIQTLNDQIPEANQMYTVRIVDVHDVAVFRDRAMINTVNDSAEILGIYVWSNTNMFLIS